MFDRVRIPQSPIQDRCGLCTVINGLVLLLLCGILSAISAIASAVVFALGVVVIWYRGYIIPFAPRIGPAILSSLPADVSTDSRRSESIVEGSYDESELLDVLLESEILIADGEKLRLTPEFYDQIDDEIRHLRTLSDSELFEITIDEIPSAETVEIADSGRREWIVVSDGTDSISGETWISRPALLAELSSIRALSRCDTHFDPELEIHCASALLAFLDECPECGRELEVTNWNACCGSNRHASGRDEVLACVDCETVIHKYG